MGENTSSTPLLTMHLLSSLRLRFQPAAFAVFIFTPFLPVPAHASPSPALVDDFSAEQRHGANRLLIDDKTLGSLSQATQRCENGVLIVEGELVPGRGVPAFISIPLLLSADAQPHDVGLYEGVRLRVKITQGSLAVQVATTPIENFDYHTSVPIAGKRGEFKEVRVAFKDMKRGWSEQVPLDPATVTSVNLVAFGLARGAFAYAIDEIGFY